MLEITPICMAFSATMGHQAAGVVMEMCIRQMPAIPVFQGVDIPHLLFVASSR